MASPNDLQFQEFDEAAELLSARPRGLHLSMVLPQTTSTTAAGKGGGRRRGGEDVKLCLFIGPFWICVTLVFSVAIGGNLSSFLSEKGNPSYHYRPQFHRVTIAALVIFMYAWLVPVGLWGFLTWRQGAERQIGGYSFLETVCVYGYSLFIYIPTSVLWIIPFEWLRWTLILVAMVISGSVLVLTFWPVVREDTKVMAVATVVTIVVLHTLLAVGCKMYFFQTEVHVTSAAPITPTINMTIATKAH
ncbi:LOW QUALITY PROTEIN: protein YIPF1-like [Notothenia coriiceps]|uniref:Protein YIPF n=1 Tax=Notothenia coriiceps TaxID=8208 RepID=A0A6I9NNL1_9TELE|nr:PREDICTED: LOW QUALITY PROTEIN: protein YIPF1-like [Notothenia coriiceps]